MPQRRIDVNLVQIVIEKVVKNIDIRMKCNRQLMLRSPIVYFQCNFSERCKA